MGQALEVTGGLGEFLQLFAELGEGLGRGVQKGLEQVRLEDGVGGEGAGRVRAGGRLAGGWLGEAERAVQRVHDLPGGEGGLVIDGGGPGGEGLLNHVRHVGVGEDDDGDVLQVRLRADFF